MGTGTKGIGDKKRMSREHRLECGDRARGISARQLHTLAATALSGAALPGGSRPYGNNDPAGWDLAGQGGEGVSNEANP
jgi:hypothetical protein